MKQWTVADVMTRDVVAVSPSMSYTDVADVLVSRMVSAAPVVDERGWVLGVVSEIDVLSRIEYGDRMPRHPLAVRRLSRANQVRVSADVATAADAMTFPAITVTEGASFATAARLLDAARVKRLPVLSEAGRLVGIISHRDLMRLYSRPDATLRAEADEAVRCALGGEARHVDVRVHGGAVMLSGVVPSPRDAYVVQALVSGVPGVIAVDNRLAIERPPTASAAAVSSPG